MLIDRVRDFAARHALWSPDTRIVVALSGGGDSVALLHLLAALHEAGALGLAGACHIHHHIRGVEADADEAFCRELAVRLGVRLLVAHRDVPALAAASGQSLEVAARLARREALLEAREALAADRVATAHTRDDQAETVLLRIVRGTGLAGLGGIAPINGLFIRPLLDLSRHELRAWLTAQNATWREDATNLDVRNPRNRVRHELLPAVRAHLNPSGDRALARLADLARADEEVLRDAAAAAATRVLAERPEGIAIDRQGMAALPTAIMRRVAAIALETARPDRAYDLREVDRISEACRRPPGGPLQFRGLLVERNRADVVLLIRPPSTSPAPAPFRYELQVPGSVSVPEAGWVVAAERAAAGDVGGEARGAQVALVAAELCGDRLWVRSRKAGDWLRLPGGRTKLQDLLVNRKVARRDRDRTPIVTTSAGRIVWVGGIAVADEFRVGDPTKAVVVLKLRRL